MDVQFNVSVVPTPDIHSCGDSTAAYRDFTVINADKAAGMRSKRLSATTDSNRRFLLDTALHRAQDRVQIAVETVAV